MSETYGSKDTHNPIIAVEMFGENLVSPVIIEDVGHTKQDCHNWMKGKVGSFIFSRRVCTLRGEEVKSIKVSEI